MLFSEVWNRDDLPQELKDIILDFAIPTRLPVRIHQVRRITVFGERIEYAVEMKELSQWAALHEIMAYSEEKKKIVLWKLREEGVLVIVDGDNCVLSSQETQNLLLADPEVLRVCKWAEVSEPYSIVFRRAQGKSTHGCALLKLRIRVEMPDLDANYTRRMAALPALTSETTWQIDRASSPILVPESLNWAMNLIKPYVANNLRSIQPQLINFDALEPATFLYRVGHLPVYLGSECGNSTTEYDFGWENRGDARERLKRSQPQWETIDIFEIRKKLMAECDAEKAAENASS